MCRQGICSTQSGEGALKPPQNDTELIAMEQPSILVSTVPADGPAPNGAGPSADTTMIKFGSCISMT